MNKPENMEERLWDYIDGLSSEEEKSFVAQLIETNLEWRRKYHELLDVHQLMQHNIELDEPSMRFTQNVMDLVANEKIAPAASSYIKKSVIRVIAGFFILSITALVIWMLANVNWSAPNTGKSLDLPKVDLNKYLSPTVINGMIIATVVMALMLLDMTLRKKQKRNREMTDH
ncbi:hypothetical protein HHL16_20240 [Pseudoflavitalea sp. G-6-1-2]|uniref:anti-sigma factor family protein n=1 Tax=Pseudoflavitalea sp. G-6-1-2 TaxID=2728841 RepID=UPI00146F1152|nr:hypothetical protein [Pseudoflavitalea sp. G-6-1-2]NML23219.1 hypothetical protein [Pseudoflavitalea sp. G-6-1-2]